MYYSYHLDGLGFWADATTGMGLAGSLQFLEATTDRVSETLKSRHYIDVSPELRELTSAL